MPVVRYYPDIQMQRLEFSMKLPEEWWKADFREARAIVYEICKDLDRVPRGPKYLKLLGHYQNKTGTTDPEYQSFTRLAFFFADLNTYLEMKLVNPELVYRLFGEAQYAFFEPLFDEIRPEVRDDRVRWVWETKSLSRLWQLKPRS